MKLLGEWEQALKAQMDMPYFQGLKATLEKAYQEEVIFPPKEEIFNAFYLTPLSKVRVVILGQDPYHGKDQGMGLAFSVKENVPLPPSLINIYKEISRDLKVKMPACGDLTSWARQGVFLLNTTLTVKANQANSHKNIGWATFTDSVLEVINEQERPIVYLLWGGFARSKKRLLTNPKHLVLESSHPSPLSVYRGFAGCGHFSQCNQFLVEQGQEPIHWQII